MTPQHPHCIAVLANEAGIGPAKLTAIPLESRSTPCVRVWLTTPLRGEPVPVADRIKLVMN